MPRINPVQPPFGDVAEQLEAMMPPELWGRLSAELTDAQLLDVLMLCGWYHAISFTANGAKVKLEEGAPRFADVLWVRPRRRLDTLTTDSSLPSIREPLDFGTCVRQGRRSTYPSVPLTRIRCPSRMRWVACSTPTTAGKPYSRAITAPWVMRPPTSVTRPAMATNRGDQLGSV